MSKLCGFFFSNFVCFLESPNFIHTVIFFLGERKSIWIMVYIDLFDTQHCTVFYCAVLAFYSQQRPFCGIWRSKNGLRMLSMAKRLGSMSLNSPIVKQGRRKFWKSRGPLIIWWASWLVTDLQKIWGYPGTPGSESLWHKTIPDKFCFYG